MAQGRPTVLVVEDNPDLRASLMDLFGAAHYLALGADNGAEALRLMEEQIPALIVTDLGMPVMDGRQLIEAVRARARLRDVPVIVFSAEPAAPMETTLGTLEFVAKRSDIAVLLSRASEALRRSHLRPDGG